VRGCFGRARVMGAGVSAAQRASPPTPLNPGSAAAASFHPTAAGVAARGTPPAQGSGRPIGPLFGAVFSRHRRRHLRSQIDTLQADLNAVKTHCANVERDLQEERTEREQNGVPSTECVVCMAACVSTVLLPCGHLCLCINCANTFQQLRQRPESKGVSCPLCRLPITNMHRVFLPVEEHVLKQAPPKPALKLTATRGQTGEEKEDGTGTPTGSDSSGSNDMPGESVGVQVSPSLRRAGSQPLYPRPRVYKRSSSLSAQPRLNVHGRAAEMTRSPRAWTNGDEENDIVMRPSRSIVRPPSSPHPTDVIEVRGSPTDSTTDRPESYDFVLPGAYVPDVPDAIPLFSRTWDGALRVRD